MSDKDPFSDVSKRRDSRLQAFRDFFSGKKSKPKLGTSDGKGLGSSGGLTYGSLEETINRPDAEEVRLSPVHEHIVDADKIVGEAEFYQARPFSDKKGQRITQQFTPFREEHEPYGLRDDGIICVSKAYLYEIHPTNNTLTRHPLEPLQISIEGEGVVYTTYKTDDHGKVKVEEAQDGGDAPPAYTLMFGEALPDNTDYVLPDENGNGQDGEYFTPICYIKDFKVEAKQFQDGRQAMLRGSLEGHRGPLWWIAGYDALKNVGVGQNVYKDYTEADDFKNLRTISELGQTQNCSGDNRVSGNAQVKVGTNGDTINVHGNRYNKTWKVGDKKQGIVEDGLVRCLGDLPVETLTKQQLNPVTVVTGYSSSSSNVTAAAYPTASDKVNVLSASGTPVSAAPPHAESDRAAAWSGGSTGNAYTGGTAASAAPPHAESDRGFAWSGGDMLTQAIHAYDTASCAAAPTSSDATTLYAGGSSAVNAYTGGSLTSVVTGVTTEDAWTGGGNGQIVTGVTAPQHTNMWKGGRVVAGAGLERYKVLAEDEYGNDTYIWVLGIEASSSSGGSSGGGNGENDPPDFPRLLTDDGTTNQITTASAVSSVTAATGYGIVGDTSGSLQEKGFVDGAIYNTGGIVGASTTPVVGRTNPVSVLKDTVGEVTNVVRNPQTIPVITGANYNQKFLKGEASPVTGLKKDMTDTTVIANAVDTQKFLKGEASPVSIPVAGSPVSVIKGSLPSVSISVPVATGTAEVYEENTNWTGGLLDAANVSASQGLKVVKEPESESCDSCS